MWRSVCPPTCPPVRPIHQVFVMKINLCNGLPTETRVNFPPASIPRVTKSDSFLFTDDDYLIM